MAPQEGRKLWGEVVKRCRDGARLAVAYTGQQDMQRLVAYLQAFPWALKARISCLPAVIAPHCRKWLSWQLQEGDTIKQHAERSRLCDFAGLPAGWQDKGRPDRPHSLPGAIACCCAAVWATPEGKPTPQAAAKHCCVAGALYLCLMLAECVQQDDPGPPIRGLLPPSEAAAVLAAANMPFAVALRLTRLVADLPRSDARLPESIRVSNMLE